MTEAAAVPAAEQITRDFPGVLADAVDPRSTVFLGLDQASARTIRDALTSCAGSGNDVGGLLELFDEWLKSGKHPS